VGDSPQARLAGLERVEGRDAAAQGRHQPESRRSPNSASVAAPCRPPVSVATLALTQRWSSMARGPAREDVDRARERPGLVDRAAVKGTTAP
jgi:hypothetical protein